jgi:hypothetical protein
MSPFDVYEDNEGGASGQGRRNKLTWGDNPLIMGSPLALCVFGVEDVLADVFDPGTSETESGHILPSYGAMVNEVTGAESSTNRGSGSERLACPAVLAGARWTDTLAVPVAACLFPLLT